jgi:hypothetical protein
VWHARSQTQKSVKNLARGAGKHEGGARRESACDRSVGIGPGIRGPRTDGVGGQPKKKTTKQIKSRRKSAPKAAAASARKRKKNPQSRGTLSTGSAGVTAPITAPPVAPIPAPLRARSWVVFPQAAKAKGRPSATTTKAVLGLIWISKFEDAISGQGASLSRGTRAGSADWAWNCSLRGRTSVH